MIKFIQIIFSVILVISCSKTNQHVSPNQNNHKMNNEKIIQHVKLAINPKFQDWVLFKNGTYIIFDKADTIKNVKEEAISQMKEFGPVHAGTPAGDFEVITLKKTDGWIVSGHGYGMYTYVNPSELQSNDHGDLEIGLFGRSKRELDGENPEIIYVSKKK